VGILGRGNHNLVEEQHDGLCFLESKHEGYLDE